MDTSVKKLILMALNEDLEERGDVTSQYFVPTDKEARAMIKVKDHGVIAGLEIAEMVCEEVDPQIQVTYLAKDGDTVSRGQYVMELRGKAQSILTAERVVLNFMQRLSGVATKTSLFVARIAHTTCQVLDTRKTTPGWRKLEKMAVELGGGKNHRMGLYDRAMVKDNHLVAENSLEYIQGGIDKLFQDHPSVEVQLEVDTLDQLRAFMSLRGVHYILLDNMCLDELKEALQIRKLANSTVKLEASGGVTLDTVAGIAESGVDYVSVGALTHSAVALDISLEFVPLD